MGKYLGGKIDVENSEMKRPSREKTYGGKDRGKKDRVGKDWDGKNRVGKDREGNDLASGSIVYTAIQMYKHANAV